MSQERADQLPEIFDRFDGETRKVAKAAKRENRK